MFLCFNQIIGEIIIMGGALAAHADYPIKLYLLLNGELMHIERCDLNTACSGAAAQIIADQTLMHQVQMNFRMHETTSPFLYRVSVHATAILTHGRIDKADQSMI